MKPINALPVSGNRGFALVVTLSLMILLTIIAVGLLTLSSVALRSSGQSSAMAEARQNARMALMIALGELQKYAGPDQRVTAPADIAGTADGSALAAGAQPLNDQSVDKVSKRLSPVQPGTRYWTGVFVNQDAPASIITKTPSPINIQWLVSGSNSSYSPANPAGGPDLLPSNAAYAVNATGNVADATRAVVLAGENTVGAASGATERYVVAPLVGLYQNNGAKPKGRFAWWVGDEGVKAKINIERTMDDPSRYASLSAQRRGWETVAGFEEYPAPGSGLHASLPKVTDLAQTALLLPGTFAETGGASPLQGVFHSATADSRAVLVDALNGGTRIDLGAALSGNLPTTSRVSTIANYPVKGGDVILKTRTIKMRAPKWDAVKDFSDRHDQLQSGNLIVKAAASDDVSAIAPLVTDFRILMGAVMKVKDSRANTYNINACGKIAVAIANPYSVPLKWNRDIEFEVLNQTPSGNQPSRIWNLGNNTAYIPANPGQPAVFNNVVFRIRSSSLDPGEARAYTIASSAFRTQAAGTQRLVMDLSPFQTSSPFDFSNCIELENPSVITITGNSPSMDVRESWQTTLLMLEMRLSGSSGILRRIERFELDNGYFSPNARSFPKSEVDRITKPFPLMCYSFQISQPGEDYKSLMPAAYELGQRGSTLRTFADFNLQAARFRKPIASYNPPPYFMESNNSKSQLPATPPGGDTGTNFTRNLALSPMPWGRSSSGPRQTILFSVPSKFSSIAQLQHADLTGDDLGGSLAHQPGNAVGNSYATPFVKRSLTNQIRTDYELMGSPNHSGANQSATTYYDISYLLNASLWDSYFFSTIPGSGSAVPENPTLIRLDTSDSATAQLRDPVKAASLLMVDGAFNVNSTDKNAWKAFLASAKHFKHKAGPAGATDAAFPRSLEQTSPSINAPTGSDVDSFSGYRRLTDSQIDALAGEIVKQVRLRGPFVSLSHFVNRALADLTAQPALTRSGALQQALDECGANIDIAGNKNAFSRISASNDALSLQWKQGGPRADMDGNDLPGRPPDADSQHPDWAYTSTDNNFGSVASIVADQDMLRDYSPRGSVYTREQGYRSTGIPGWITQADVLQVIGNSLTSRSDTFRIRAYGESLDASGTPVAKAWCEAIVQRVPAYIDPSNEPSARGAALSQLNQTYGRKFEIVSFRWLSSREI